MKSAARRLAVALALGFVATTLLLASCDSGDSGGSDATGSSSIQGTVVSFSSGTAFFVPSAPESLLARALALFVPDAAAGLGGVNVRIRGTDLEGTTALNGYFIISGVPGGTHTLDFAMGAENASIDVAVPENATVTLNSVNIAGGAVSTGGINIEIHPSAASSTNSPGNGSLNLNGNDNV